jgi:parallel beta-helix repeat protein
VFANRGSLAAGLAVLAALAVAEARTPSVADANGHYCDRSSAPGQSPGTFVRSLRPGQTGCLRPGVHVAGRDGVTFRRPRVTLRSRGRGPATLVGRVWVARGANKVKIRDLVLDGRNPKDQASPNVNANHVVLRDNEITNHHTGICVLLGSDDYGRASGTVIRHNRIHDCGRLPATNHDHGIYVAFATGTVIARNRIYDNADRGIQLYPDADRTRISDNVISGNGQGVIFSGSKSHVSENNLVKRNVIKNSVLRWNVEWHWQGKEVGSGNVVRRNCIFGGARDEGGGGIRAPYVGFVARDNRISQSRCSKRYGPNRG